MAATLAVGPGAALSHRTAAELWAIIRGCSSPANVTAPGRGGRKRREGLIPGWTARKVEQALGRR